jgi:hypothetical protein
MNKIAKKEIRQSVEQAIDGVLLKFNVSSSPKKIGRLSETFSRKFAEEVKVFLKKKSAEDNKILKATQKEAKKTISKRLQA